MNGKVPIQRRQTNRDLLREIAYDNRGFVSVPAAAEIGVPNIELAKLAARGHLEHVAYGLYRMPEIPRSPDDQFTEAILRTGEHAFLRGESVLALLGLADVNPTRITVGVPGRVRRSVPPWMEVTRAAEGAQTTFYNGVRSQPVSEAILESIGRIPRDRLHDAALHARREGRLTASEAEHIQKVLSS